MSIDHPDRSRLYWAVLFIFLAASLVYLGQLFVAIVKLLDASPNLGRVLYFTTATINSNATPMFAILTALAIGFRSQMALWIHIGNGLTAFHSFAYATYWSLFVQGDIGLPMLVTWAFVLVPIPMLAVLRKRGELT